MAIDPTIPQDVVTSFVKPQKSFFPTKISVMHNQLRHLISSPATNSIYFANLKDVYRVDVNTNKRTHIQELPFEPRCTATGHGFFVAGDEHGYLAFIQIPESSSAPFSAAPGPLPDFTLGTDQPNVDASSHDMGNNESCPRVGNSLQVRIEQVGNDIMNSLSIHKLVNPAPGLESDIVVALTNNDKVVRLFSLTRGRCITVDDFDFPMNHASISPDGRRLAVVGDKEYIYFYQRVECPRRKPVDSETGLGYKFELQVTLPLHKPTGASHSAYFTTAWSPSGRLFATASEDGYITIFEVDALDTAEGGSDAVLTIVPSSRPMTPGGAIRTMTFAPEPWDLLLWAENNGRMCVGDLRHGLLSRQVVALDSKADGVDRIPLTESSILGDTAELDLELELERSRRQAQADFPELESLAGGLNEHERQILEGLRTTRQREEQYNDEALEILRRHRALDPHRRQSPRSITYYPAARNRIESAYGEEAANLMFGDRTGIANSSRRTTAARSPSDPWYTIEAAIDRASAARNNREDGNLRSYANVTARHMNLLNRASDDSSPQNSEPTVTDPNLSNTNLPSTATSVTLPSLRDRLPELIDGNASTRPSDDPSRRTDIIARGLNRQLARSRDRLREALRDPAQDRDPAAAAAAAAAPRPRDLARLNLRDTASMLGRYDSNILRRVGVRIGSNEAASLRRVYGLPNTQEEALEMGEGTAGVAVGDGGRHVYVGTEEGIWVLRLDFASRKGNEAVEMC